MEDHVKPHRNNIVFSDWVVSLVYDVARGEVQGLHAN